MSTLRVHLDEETRDFFYRHNPAGKFSDYRTPIHPMVLDALGERHNVTHTGELLFDPETMGHEDMNKMAFQRWDANPDSLWQVNELRGEQVKCLLPMVPYSEGAQQMHQALYTTMVNNRRVFYWVATDGESGSIEVTRIESITKEC